MKTRSDKYPEILADMADQVAEKLTESGIPEERAAQVGFETAERVRQTFGGETIYVPKAVQVELTKRDAEVIAAFRAGGTRAEIARKFGLTRQRICQILLEDLAAGFRRGIQEPLFAGADDEDETA